MSEHPDHPDYLDRPIGSYDPREPLVVPYGDVIAARNAVANLITVMRGGLSPDAQTWIMMSVATGVAAGLGNDEFDDVDDAIDWLVALRDRLSGCLPTPAPTPPRTRDERNP